MNNVAHELASTVMKLELSQILKSSDGSFRLNLFELKVGKILIQILAGQS